MQTGIVRIGDREIEFARSTERSTDRKPAGEIVMLHEGLGSTSMWRDFPERLATATGLRTLAYSRYGYGRSTPLAGPRTVDYMHEEAVVWLPALLERFAIERPVLFGHSDGASIALIYAAERPHEVAALVALAPHIRVEELTLRSIERARTSYLEEDLKQRLSRHHANVDSAFWGWNRIWLDPAFRSWSIEGLLGRIRCPVLAIQGEQDEYGTMEQLTGIARAVRDTRLLALPDSGHAPHRDQPDAVLEATARFLVEVLERAHGRAMKSHGA